MHRKSKYISWLTRFLNDSATGPRSREKIYTENTAVTAVKAFAAEEDAKISLISAILVMFIFVLVTMVTNTGVVVKEKIEVQNAADSASYSTAVWMSRGMNSITACNHVMGEMTALHVIIDSISGPDFWNAESRSTYENDEANDAINWLSADYGKVHLATAQGTIGKFIAKFEAKLLEAIPGLMSEGDAGKLKAGAMLYDAQLTVKYWTGYCVKFKQILNTFYGVSLLFAWIPGVELASSGLTTAGHLALDTGLVFLVKDFILLKGVEYLALGLQPIKKTIPYIVLGVSIYGDSIAKRGRLVEPIEDAHEFLTTANNVSNIISFPTPQELKLPVEREEFPSQFESDRRNAGDYEVSVVPSLFMEDQSKKSKIVTVMVWPDEAIGKLIEGIKNYIDVFFGFGIFKISKWLEDDLKLLNWGKIKSAVGFPKEFDQLDGFTGYSSGSSIQPNYQINKVGGVGYPLNFSLWDENRSKILIPKLDWEAESKSQWVRATYPYVREFRGALNQVLFDFASTSNGWTYLTCWTNRYTIITSHQMRSGELHEEIKDLFTGTDEDSDRKKLQKHKQVFQEIRDRFDVARYGPNSIEELLKFEDDQFDQIFEDTKNAIDKAEKDFPKFAAVLQAATEMAESVRKSKDTARDNNPREESGEDDESFAEKMHKAIEIESNHLLLLLVEETIGFTEEALSVVEFTPPHMHVIRGSNADNKGSEIWTNLPERADEYFTVIAAAHRRLGETQKLLGTTKLPIFKDVLFSNPNREGYLAFSQAMIYNANGRGLAASSNDNLFQPNTGWDTLNWKPPVRAPEWMHSNANFGDKKPAADIFTGKFDARGKSSEVRINWQAKLVPVTPQRLEGLMDSDEIPPRLSKFVKETIKSTPNFISH